jgi:propanol-preferring alcohol dehydrogenase
MSDIPQFPYALLWGERRLCSVANLTRRDGSDFIALAQQAGFEAGWFPIRLKLQTTRWLSCAEAGSPVQPSWR